MHYNDDRPDSLCAHYCAGDLKMTIINYSVIININETRFITTLLSIQNHNFGIKSFFAFCLLGWGVGGGGLLFGTFINSLKRTRIKNTDDNYYFNAYLYNFHGYLTFPIF